MKDSLYFTAEERLFFERVIDDGLLQRNRRGVYWWVVRLAIAQSLRMENDPDERYRAVGGRERSELHLEQITGRAKSPDYDDAMIMIMSLRHGTDLFDDHDLYVDWLQRHARRGLQALEDSWRPGTSFHDLLLDGLYHGAAESAADGDAMSETIDFAGLQRGLHQISVKASLSGEPREGPRLTRFTLTLGGVEDYDRLRRGLEDLAFAIGLGSGRIAVERGRGERRVILDVPRPLATWRDVPWRTVRPVLEDARGALPVCPGVDVVGDPVVFDLAEAPHLFVAGATGSGKSVCVNAILLSLLRQTRPPALVMIDPKGVDFADYDGCRLLRGKQVITDMSVAVTALRELTEEMDARQEILRDKGARNIAEAQSAGADLERIVVVVDELADLLITRTGAEEPLVRLAQKARAVGIHLLLATQRPEAATFPGLLRANIPSRIALTVQKASDSRIILDESGAEDLMMKGDMLIKLAGREAIRAHGARVERSDILAAVSAVNGR
ncbi:MAG: FtsK/SpoIIIE domain-containing protein [Allosphingosinicella sp.]